MFVRPIKEILEEDGDIEVTVVPRSLVQLRLIKQLLRDYPVLREPVKKYLKKLEE